MQTSTDLTETSTVKAAQYRTTIKLLIDTLNANVLVFNKVRSLGIQNIKHKKDMHFVDMWKNKSSNFLHIACLRRDIYKYRCAFSTMQQMRRKQQ